MNPGVAAFEILRELRRRVRLIAARAFVHLTDDSKRAQVTQVQLLAGETRVVERFQNYGVTSVPHDPTGQLGAEAVVVFMNGDRSHGIAVVVEDRRYRLKNLAKGEVALYDDLGQMVKLGRSLVTVKGTTKVRVEAPEVDVVASTKVKLETPTTECTGNLQVGGNVVAVGQVSDAAGSMQEMRDTFNAHVHFVNNTPGHTQPPTVPMT